MPGKQIAGIGNTTRDKPVFKTASLPQFFETPTGLPSESTTSIPVLVS